MLTYLNEYCERVAVTNEEDTILWHKIDDILTAMNDNDFNNLIELIGDYVWALTGERRKAANRLRPYAKKMGFSIYELEMWYCIEEF